MRILPSQAAAMLRDIVPDSWASEGPTFDHNHAQIIAGIFELVNAVPDELLDTDGTSLSHFVQAKAAIAMFLAGCSTLGNSARGLPGIHLVRLRDILERCPDRVVPPIVNDLLFIADVPLRDNLRVDLASIETSIRDADWKPATVMAGSVAEALLLFCLQQNIAASTGALGQLRVAGELPTGVITDLERLGLHEYIAIAHSLDIISAETAALLDVLKRFRNLIHPGRSARLNASCDRGTAHSALGAVLRLIRDIQ
jgi:hypothetical protein